MDELYELQVANQLLAEEVDSLNVKLAVSFLMDEDQKRAEEIIEDLNKRVRLLEAENSSLKSSLQTYMNKSAELIKQVNFFKRKITKLEKK